MKVFLVFFQTIKFDLYYHYQIVFEKSLPDEIKNKLDIFKNLMTLGEDVGLATVYRVLTQFEQAGICIRHNFEEGRAVYELTPTSHHDHMVCVETGDIIEFECDEIERLQEKVAKENGYEIVDHSMVIYVKPLKK